MIKKVSSAAVTLLIVLMLILAPSAEAVSVSISGLQADYVKGTSVNFTVSISINDPDTYVPVSNISVNITGPDSMNRTFALDGTPVSGSDSITIAPVSTPQPDEFGFGYGYGCDEVAGGCTDFGYGYGYGYGYGAGGGTVTYVYNVSINTSSLASGSYNAVASLNTGNSGKPSFDSAQATFKITPPDTTPPEITNFTVIPSTGINPSNPAFASADVTDANLTAVEFLMIDSSDLIRINHTIVGIHVNMSGINGTYTSPPWHAVSADASNGTVRNVVTVLSIEGIEGCPECTDYLIVPGLFRKNGSEPEIIVDAMFNKSTLTLDSIIEPQGGAEKVIENGISTIRLGRYEFANGIGNPPEFSVPELKYTLYDIGSADNPYLIFRTVPSGSYTVMVHAVDAANNHNVQDTGITVSAAPAETPTPSRGGGGGGGVTSGEPYANIDKREIREEYLVRDKPATYRFVTPEIPVREIIITASTNAGTISVQVELLKDISTISTQPAPGIVYRYLNIWVGTRGFAVPENIKEAIIKFRVENSWLNDNNLQASDISMLRWNTGWSQIETREVNRDADFTYFEAKTNAFSPFTIAAKVPEVVPPITETPVPEETAPTPAPTEAPGFGIVLVIATLSALYILSKRR